MENSRTNHVVKNLIMSIINIIIGAILPFFVRTLMIKCLGSEYMGLNNFCSAILYALNASDLGVSNAFAYQLYKPVEQKNSEEICKLLRFYKKVYLIIGICILIVGLCLMPFLRYFIKSDIPQGINIQFVFLLYLLNTVIGYLTFAYKNTLLTADQRRDWILGLSTLSFLFIYGSQIILIITRHYYISVFVLPFFTFIENLLLNIIIRKQYPMYFPKGTVSIETRNSIKKDIFAVLIYRVRDISRNSFDNVVISTFAGLVILSNFQNYYAIFNIPFLMLSIFSSSFAPSIGNYAVTHNKEEVFHIYRKSAFIQATVAGWFAICYGFLIGDFIGDIWLGEEYRLSAFTAFLFAVYIYVLGENYTLKTIRESIGLLNYGKQWAILEMISNLALNIGLMAYMGVEGILCGTIFSMLFISIPAENYIIYKHYFRGMFRERLRMILENVIWIVITVILVFLLMKVSPLTSIIGFIYKVCVCALIPFLTLFVIFRKSEDLRYIVNMIKIGLRKSSVNNQ